MVNLSYLQNLSEKIADKSISIQDIGNMPINALKDKYKAIYTTQYQALQDLKKINQSLTLYLKQNPVGKNIQDVYKNDTTTNDRKSFYETQSYEALKYWFWFFISIYVVFAAYVLYLIYDTKYSQYIKVIAGLVIICYPICIYFVIDKILNAIYAGYNMLPTNVNFSP